MELAALLDHISATIDRQPPTAELVQEVRRHVDTAIREDAFIVECVERTIAQSGRCLAGGEPYRSFHFDEERRWKIALFLWEPGFHNTPHQHNTWSVSGVMCNEIEVALFDVGPQGRPGAQRRRFVAGRGESGYLVPPCIHALGNPHPSDSSVTLHVFSLSADPRERENDTVWFDDVRPQDFYRDPRLPALRDLQSALVLLRSIRTPRAPELLERVFAVGDARLGLEAYKQMARCDPAAALPLGEQLLERLPAADRERFAALQRRLRELPPPAARPAWQQEDEYALQHAIGCLMRSPSLTDEATRHGVDTALPQLAAPVRARLARILHASGRRFGTLSRMFDARAREDVLRLLPLVRLVLEEGELLAAWHAFERRHAATDWENLSRMAVAFCAETVDALPRGRLRHHALGCDLLRYEAALLRLALLQADFAAGRQVDARPALGPRVTPARQVLRCETRLASLLPGLRAATAGAPDPAAREAALEALLRELPAGGQSLLLFASAAGGPVHAMVISEAIAGLLAACDGSRTREELAGLSPLPADTVHRALARLAQAGVLEPAEATAG